jgi:hypothetical protein
VAARRIDRTYDQRNRLRTVRYSDGRGDLDHAYAPDGVLSGLTVDNGDGHVVTTSYAYNARRLLTRETVSHGEIHWPIDHAYDANGHLSAQSWDGLTVSYAPNGIGQPTRAGTFATGVRYHPNGAIQQFTYGNGIVHTLSQNARQLPDTSVDAYGGTAFLSDAYDYDATGNVAAITDGATGRNQRGNRTMAYDGMDRLVSATSPMFGNASYTYDALDNLTRGAIGGTAARDHWYCHDASNRLTNVKTDGCGGSSVIGLGYDAQGNLANKNGVAYAFDYGNRLRSVATANGPASYAYDGHGRRVLDTTTAGAKHSQYTQAGRLALTLDERANKRSQHVYLGGSLVAIREQDLATGTFKTKYQHTDALGTPVVVTDEARIVVARSEYEPYGKVLNRAIGDGPGFTGHVEDSATGLMYMQQRYYDPLVVPDRRSGNGVRQRRLATFQSLRLCLQQPIQVHGPRRARRAHCHWRRRRCTVRRRHGTLSTVENGWAGNELDECWYRDRERWRRGCVDGGGAGVCGACVRRYGR